MGFKRLLVWLIEKLFELHLAIAAVLIVKIFLPLSGDAYTSLSAFAAGVQDTYRGALEDAAYVSANFLGGSYVNYAFQTYLAAAYVVVRYAYLASLYIFLSLLACLLGQRHYVRNAVAAFGFAALIFAWRFVHAYDLDMLRLAIAVIVLGLGAVLWSAWLGEGLHRRLSGKSQTSAPRSPTGRVRLDLGA
ncbi:hypothetical protein ABAC460_19170 [Asticcacaulis sp. AC460]|uniref:hypothetical protein n=1 Tax=Asticcacaulis sp. AC460 TaxID=1282360 RepID=UPI0003C3B492|nr:hypothetical protein [Asticcacaulis sp. AC460]ESQ87449.1 hypothetical protein ABAC460_19170 [Asticcacaulis sp. AC460]